MLAVERNLRQVRLGLDLHEYVAVADFVLEKFQRVLQHGHHARRLQLEWRGPDRAQELRDDAIEPLDFLLGHIEQVAQVGALRLWQRGQLAPDQLQVDIQRVQRVADLVRHTRRQQHQRVQPLRLQRLRHVLALAGYIAQNNDGTWLLRPHHGQRHHIERHETALRIDDLDLAPDEPRPLLLIEPHHARPIQPTQITPDRLPGNLFAFQPEQLRRRVIRIGNAPFAIKHDDAFLNRMKNRFEQPLLLR